jgi:hypothetical protein
MLAGLFFAWRLPSTIGWAGAKLLEFPQGSYRSWSFMVIPYG